MAASPVNGERPTGFRRSSSQFASLPHRSLSLHEKVGLAKDDAAADVLYTHPSVRIYTFQPPTDALKSLDKTKKTLPDADYPIDAIEILPWRARTETLAARGKLIIEKVQGSVHFLKAGDLIHTIMKNSQCWCVDGESKFVMRVGRLRYQRIEMPTTDSDERQKVEEFKEVIGKILKFEKTPCPFIRAFQIDLPDDAITPRRRGTWKRKESLSSTTAEDDPRPVRRNKTARTMSMRAMPPNSFPSKSLTQLDMERPRTASTPTNGGRFSFPDVRVESPIAYASGDDNTDSDRHDSESDRPETGHSSEFEESDREISSITTNRSPLNHVQTLSPVTDRYTFEEQQPYQSTNIFAVDSEPPVIAAPVPPFKEYKLSVADARTPEPEFMKAVEVKTDPLPRTISNDIVATNHTDDVAQASLSTLSSKALESTQDLLPILPKPESSIQPDLLATRPSTSVEKQASTVEHTTKPPFEEITTTLQTDTTSDAELKTAEDIGSTELNAEKEALPSPPVPDLPPAPLPVPSPVQAAIIPTEPVDEVSISVARKDPMISEPDLTRSVTNDDAESVLSTDSFHTTLSDEEPVGYKTGGLGTRPFQHRRELSEMTVTAESVNDQGEGILSQKSTLLEPIWSNESVESTDQDSTWPEMRTPGAFADDSEIRQRLKHRRSLSPLPPASILHSSNHASNGSPIPAELFQKAANLAVIKPLEVLVFVMQVLARIAGGATMNDLVSGDLFRRPGVRRTASGTFEQNIRGRSTVRDSEEEDDYGVPVHGRRKSSNKEGDKPKFTLEHDIDDAASSASID